MSYKMVRAIALGTAALSTGIVHFDPERKGDDPRYQGGIFPTGDAIRLEKKRIGKIEGDASEDDYKRWQTELMLGSPTVDQAAGERISASVEEDEDVGGDAAVSNLNAIAFPDDQPARAPDAGLTIDPDAAPGANGSLAEPSILDGNLKSLTASLDGIDDVDQLRSLRTAEEGGKSRAGALDAIDARIAAVEGGGSE